MKADPLKVRHPFFRQRWRRVAATAACLGWGTFEISMGNGLWASLFLGIGAYLVWEFFLNFDPANYEDTTGTDTGD